MNVVVNALSSVTAGARNATAEMAGKRDIKIYKGDTYVHEVRLKDGSGNAINIAGRSYSAVMKKSAYSDDISATFTTAIANAANGIMTFSLTSGQSDALKPGTYYYDVQETTGSVVLTLLRGKAIVTSEVT